MKRYYLYALALITLACITGADAAAPLNASQIKTEVVDYKTLGTPPALSGTGSCRTYYNAANVLRTSCNGGAYTGGGGSTTDLSPGVPDVSACGSIIVGVPTVFGGNTAGGVAGIDPTLTSCDILFSSTQTFVPICILTGASLGLYAIASATKIIANFPPATGGFAWVCTKPR